MERRWVFTRIELSPQAEQLPSEELDDALTRHIQGDWGDVGEPQRLLNEFARKHAKGQIISRWRRADGDELWVTTVFEDRVTRVELYNEILAMLPVM